MGYFNSTEYYKYILTGGEEYELLFTAQPRLLDEVNSQINTGSDHCDISHIGKIVDNFDSLDIEQLVAVNNNILLSVSDSKHNSLIKNIKNIDFSQLGWNHFSNK